MTYEDGKDFIDTSDVSLLPDKTRSGFWIVAPELKQFFLMMEKRLEFELNLRIRYERICLENKLIEKDDSIKEWIKND